MKIVGVAVVLSLLAYPAAAVPQVVDPKTVVVEIAGTIEESYFDTTAGNAVAAALRSEAAAGLYDQHTDANGLATALTQRLRPLDGHFGVAAPAAPTPGGEAPPQIGYEDQVRRINFGFRSVDILPGNIGYIDLRFFPDIDFDDPESPERRAADAALQTVAHTDAVIVDLRDNGGGSPPMASYLASAFLPPDSNAYMIERHRSGEVVSLRPSKSVERPRLNVPVVIMISARSASAAEALPYMLQAAGRAVIVGQPSHGGASLARPETTASGFTVFVPYAATISPLTNSSWEGHGVIPDVEGPIAGARDHAWALALRMVLEQGAPEAVANENRWILETLEAPRFAPPLDSYPGQYGDVKIHADGERLIYRQGLRPPWVLRALSSDLFTVENEPTQRVRFNRDERGQISGLNVLWSEGSTSPPAQRQP
ncbi:MAG: S41 family peptidase [Phenylobacterium sp.]|jgi:hypothetical protein|uniref:S41 family peptidase n=1 Tax=Phenylobacterium sp. TaxID=1871053 RepID=UPI0025EB2754|nr:S41 family peptidase [Phenylobacterium sp.]MCA3711990.1 S41 family peptidase [Phenylobacterium sp.]MCA3722314.1 S41 family peptidase [Phenylobacterium sp.]MCA3757437.1 S41 family peptidase [Phenylobacterium sp.]MCA6228167.1 S41 family peptidase [Phenylobacterium sp.]MCA6254629.1 S41 family peptidase [Phenylobacterium sp.]